MTAEQPGAAVISRSFLGLRQLSASFDLAGHCAPGQLDEPSLLQLASELGATALPLCWRHLADEDEERADWAHALLLHLGREAGLEARVVTELEALAHRAGAPDRAKLRALALLAELGASPPEDAELSDVDSARRRSQRELALCLSTPADVARAVDHLVEQLCESELLAFVDDLLDNDPGCALALLDELLVRDEIEDACRHELRQRRAAARQIAPAAAPRTWRRGTAAGVTCRGARHPDGRRILLVSEREPADRRRWRALCVLVAANGVLLDGHYAEELTASAIERDLVTPLGREGFAFAPVASAAARGFLIESARLAVRSGRALPRPFYLGRHLLGLRDEHLEGTARSPEVVELAALLDRAIALVARREPARALPLLERYVSQMPEDAEGHAQLGLCRLGLGHAAAALEDLRRASALAPDDPLHHWNAAAAAHRAGLTGACYLALESYRKASKRSRDVAPGADQRRAIAHGFAQEYARLAVLEHPGASPRAVACAERTRRRARPRSRRRQRG
jgi:tetratricopeptide (TPR) repeat protein